MNGSRISLALLATCALVTAAGCSDTAPSAETSSSDASSSDPVSSDSVSSEQASSDVSSGVAEPVIDPGDGGDYSVDVDPGKFTSVVDNEYFPLAPGSRWIYEEHSTDGETEINTVEVLDQRKTVMGVETIVVHDVVATEDGETVEDTYDWFAQDSDGNVWYFGEDTTSYAEATPSHEGAWEAGIDGAQPGIVMAAEPAVSDTGYRQEFEPEVAVDLGQYIEVDASVSVPAGDFTDVVRTRDWTSLEPSVIEEKAYARGVGFVHEDTVAGEDTGATVDLVEYTLP